MNGVVVRTVEELKAAQKGREHPTIIIQGELAGNLIASGIISGENHGALSRPIEETLSQTKSSPTTSVVALIQELIRLHHIEVLEGTGGRQIKITPLYSNRRDK
jgi:hypothetical protein